MSTIQEFQKFIESQNPKLVFFTAAELFTKTQAMRNGAQNSEPPETLWPNIVKTAQAVDKIRHACGFQIVILSGFRSHAYNAAVGGASASRHLFFNALDIAPAQPGQNKVREIWAAARMIRDNGFFRGGIGYYAGRFVHIDTRGTNTDWKG